MARSPIEIALASETKAFKQGIESGVIAPLEDAIQELRKLGDTDGADKLEASLRDAQKATERLGDETKITAAKIEREYKDAYRSASRAADDMGDAGSAGMGKVREGAQEVSQEIGQNLGEAVSSVRGDLSDLGQVGQDTLGGLAGTLAGAGPAGIVGAAALAAGAAGLGLITASLEAAEERRQVLADRANDLAQAYMDAGTTVLDSMTSAARLSDVLTNADTRKEAEELAKTLGVDLSEAARVVAGDSNALAAAQKIQADAESELNGLIEDGVTKRRNTNSEDQQRAIHLERLIKAVDEQAGVQTDAATTARIYSDALKGMVNDAESASKEVDDLGNAVYTLPDGMQIMIDAKTGQATTDVAKFKGDLDGVPETTTAKVKVAVDSSAWDNWNPKVKVGAVNAGVREMRLD